MRKYIFLAVAVLIMGVPSFAYADTVSYRPDGIYLTRTEGKSAEKAVLLVPGSVAYAFVKETYKDGSVISRSAASELLSGTNNLFPVPVVVAPPVVIEPPVVTDPPVVVERPPIVTNPPVVCTTQAKQCPDGSFVSPSGPNCEFAACPTPVAALFVIEYRPDGVYLIDAQKGYLYLLTGGALELAKREFPNGGPVSVAFASQLAAAQQPVTVTPVADIALNQDVSEPEPVFVPKEIVLEKDYGIACAQFTGVSAGQPIDEAQAAQGQIAAEEPCTEAP